MICWARGNGGAGWFMDPTVEERLRQTLTIVVAQGKEGPREPRLLYRLDQMWLRGCETFIDQQLLALCRMYSCGVHRERLKVQRTRSNLR